MTYQELVHQINDKKSFLCIGLDADIKKIPKHLLKEEDPVFEFNKRIIEATSDLCVAYKPNIAFYETLGAKGWESLSKTLEIIPKEIFTIADAKRADIGNTSSMYARAFFEEMDFDAITVAPYMGKDSIEPFLQYANKWVIVLALTSNSGSKDFQLLQLDSGDFLYENVIKSVAKWGHKGNLMFVTGATQSAYLKSIRNILPEHFFLVPGVGAQGGSLEEVYNASSNENTGLLVNSSRGIIYASDGEDFAEQARIKAIELQDQMSQYLS